MDFKQILANKTLVYSIAGGLAVLLIVSILIGALASSSSGKKTETAKVVEEKIIKEDLDLLTTDNLGKAIEIQALLASQGITAKRKLDGTKSTIFLSNYKQSERDAALLAIVKSGLMDQNVGLEIFDKGDFTSTKEDKKIRLARAINGELARLIRKIPPINNASVFISIPEQSMFSTMQKPVTATVQITIPIGDKLDPLKVKAITNLLLGSVSGLTAENISITDTNGNVYTSIIGAEDEMLEKIEENDKYMQQKINAQLDRLIGKGNYVATVSTFLRQAPMEKSSIIYDPNQKASISEQTFVEGLGDRSSDSTRSSSQPVSVYVPGGISGGNGGAASSSQNRSYNRTARETQYGVTKTQVNEYTKAGVIEEISIAVTLEKNAMPPEATLEELKELIAHAASPKVSPDNVTIAFSDSIEPYLATDRPVSLPKPDESGNPWWITIVLGALGLSAGFYFVHGKIKKAQSEQEAEMNALREKTMAQDQQLRDFNMKAVELNEKQSQLAQGLIEAQQSKIALPVTDPHAIEEALSVIRRDLEALDAEETGEKIKSWIEQG